jgi:hypothetical protein
MALQTSDKQSMLSFQKNKRNVVVQILASSQGGTDIHMQASQQQ